jgi:hypothetical protein
VETVTPAISSKANETLAQQPATTQPVGQKPTHYEVEPIHAKGENEDKETADKDVTSSDEEQGLGTPDNTFDDVNDENEMDSVTRQRLALAKELSTAIGDDKQSKIDDSTVVLTKKNSRRTLQELRLLKKK